MGNTSYVYHTNGLLESEDGPWANDTVSYGYTINRLRQSLSLKNTSGTLLWGQTNSYDAANRLTNLVSGAGAFVYQYPTDSASRRVQKLTLANNAFIDKGNVGSHLNIQHLLYSPAPFLWGGGLCPVHSLELGSSLNLQHITQCKALGSRQDIRHNPGRGQPLPRQRTAGPRDPGDLEVPADY